MIKMLVRKAYIEEYEFTPRYKENNVLYTEEEVKEGLRSICQVLRIPLESVEEYKFTPCYKEDNTLYTNEEVREGIITICQELGIPLEVIFDSSLPSTGYETAIMIMRGIINPNEQGVINLDSIFCNVTYFSKYHKNVEELLKRDNSISELKALYPEAYAVARLLQFLTLKLRANQTPVNIYYQLNEAISKKFYQDGTILEANWSDSIHNLRNIEAAIESANNNVDNYILLVKMANYINPRISLDHQYRR